SQPIAAKRVYTPLAQVLDAVGAFVASDATAEATQERFGVPVTLGATRAEAERSSREIKGMAARINWLLGQRTRDGKKPLQSPVPARDSALAEKLRDHVLYAISARGRRRRRLAPAAIAKALMSRDCTYP